MAKFSRKNAVALFDDEAEKKEHKYELFPELINSFTKDRNVTTDDIAAMAFIMARFLTMCPAGFMAAAAYNDYANNIPDWARRAVLFHQVPRMKKAPYMKYLTKQKDLYSKKETEIIDRIQKHFAVRRIHAEQVFDMIKMQKVKPGSFFGME